MIELKGITWNHPRGLDPLVAAAREYESMHGVSIRWQVRTLQEFADYPIEKLAEIYDLLIIDHPFVGFAAATQALVPLDEYLDAAILDSLAGQSVGASHRSYWYDGHQWALAVDAAAQVSAYRADLLERSGLEVPRTWDAVFALAERARRDGAWIAIPAIPIDAIMSFCSLCANAGEDPFQPDSDEAASYPTARYALETLRRLVRLAHPGSLDWNPPMTLDRMSHTDEILYVPLLFGYSNYARAGFAPHLIRFTNIPAAGERGAAGAILGGTGIAVSPACAHPAEAAAFAGWVCSADIQRTIYVESGGQPGNRVAWVDPAVNAACNNFFLDTLETLERAYLRPRYNGVMMLQDRAGQAIHRFLRDDSRSVDEVIGELNAIYRESREIEARA